MKKYFKISIVLLLLILVLIILIKLLPYISKSNKCYDDLSLEEISIQIISSIGGKYERIEENEISLYIPIEFNQKSECILYVNQENLDEYFFISKGLSDDKINELKELIEYRKYNKIEYQGTKLENNNGYVYYSFSKDYTSAIEGIIRSFVSCN